MMRKCRWFLFMIGMVSMYLVGCVTPTTAPAPFDAKPVPSGMYQQKVDHLYFILDASSSMLEGHAGHTKIDIARSVVENFNKTMPDVDSHVSMRSFGHADKVSNAGSALMVGPKPYSPEALPEGLAKVTKAGGISPFHRALSDAAKDLKDVKAPIAMVMITDGKDMPPKTLAAAKALKDTLGDQLCIYTVQVGNDGGGKKLLSNMAGVTSCGKAVNADALASGDAMNAFVQEAVLDELADSDGDGVADDKDKCPDTPSGIKVDLDGCPVDSDGDGVTDDKDECPDTQEGVKVDDKGCPAPVPTKSAEVTKSGTWIYKDIQFEVNKSELKESSYPTLDEIVEALESQPDLKIEIQGHSDGTGNYDYNVAISERRANTVMEYLVSKGIDASRMTAKGFGPDNPIDTNDTREGRARNRRVEIKPLP